MKLGLHLQEKQQLSSSNSPSKWSPGISESHSPTSLYCGKVAQFTYLYYQLGSYKQLFATPEPGDKIKYISNVSLIWGLGWRVIWWKRQLQDRISFFFQRYFSPLLSFSAPSHSPYVCVYVCVCFQIPFYYVKVKATQSCPTLCDPMDYTSPWNSLGQILCLVTSAKQ